MEAASFSRVFVHVIQYVCKMKLVEFEIAKTFCRYFNIFESKINKVDRTEWRTTRSGMLQRIIKLDDCKENRDKVVQYDREVSY